MDPFKEPPTLLIWHSGATKDDVAKYLANPVEKETNTLRDLRQSGERKGPKGLWLCHDGKYRRQVGTHFASSTRNGDYHAMVDLHTAAWGVAGYNARAIHIEAPAHHGPDLDRQSRALVAALVQVVPSLREWTCHRWIQGNRRDPLCWSNSEVRGLMLGMGLGELGG